MRPGKRRLATRQGSGLFLFMGRDGAENGGASRREAFPEEEGDAGGGVFFLLLYRLSECSGKRDHVFDA